MEVRLPARLPRVRADRVQVGEILNNLIANAIKYNDKAEKWVEIGCNASPDKDGVTQPVFYIRDNGIGIAAQHHEAIFRIFRRLHGREEYGGGTGAGLTIVRKIVERHGGRIWLVSQPGAGATFYFTLGKGGKDVHAHDGVILLVEDSDEDYEAFVHALRGRRARCHYTAVHGAKKRLIISTGRAALLRLRRHRALHSSCSI